MSIVITRKSKNAAFISMLICFIIVWAVLVLIKDDIANETRAIVVLEIGANEKSSFMIQLGDTFDIDFFDNSVTCKGPDFVGKSTKSPDAKVLAKNKFSLLEGTWTVSVIIRDKNEGLIARGCAKEQLKPGKTHTVHVEVVPYKPQ